MSFADDILVYRQGKDRQAMAANVQEELHRLEQWCDQHNGKIHPDKASVLWCSLNNRAVKTDMPELAIKWQVIQREQSLKYLGITFDRTLSAKDHISSVVTRARRGLTAMKVMAAASMPQKTLFLLYQALVLSVIEYGFGTLTLSQSQLKRLEVIQNEAMRTILGCTRDTSAEAMRHILDLFTMEERHKLAQIKEYMRVAGDTEHPLHPKLEQGHQSRLKRGSSWLRQAARIIAQFGNTEDIRRGQEWCEVEDTYTAFTNVVATLGRECREQPAAATNAEIETLIEELSRPGDVIIFTDGSVKRKIQSGWAFSARADGRIVQERCGAYALTTSSMVMEVTAITEALKWLEQETYRHTVFVTDSMSTLAKIQKAELHTDWIRSIERSRLQKLTWLFCPGHAGVRGNERADRLAGSATIGETLTLDRATVLSLAKQHIEDGRTQEPSHTLQTIQTKGIARGAGRKSDLRGTSRRVYNQLLVETVSRQTLMWTIQRRGEQLWSCDLCDEPISGPK